METFALPPAITVLVDARNAVRAHYAEMLQRRESSVDLKFTLDGNLVGDIGEAIAAELYGVRLVNAKSTEGIDGYAPDGRTVQVKATGTKRGPAFRKTEVHADHLLFFCLDFENATGFVAFNGPEQLVRKYLPEEQRDQRLVSRPRIALADALVKAQQRLPRIS
jgi:hypothetical protein